MDIEMRNRKRLLALFLLLCMEMLAGTARAADGLSPLSSESSNEEIIYAYLTDTLGLNTAATCGILANLHAESAFDPGNLQNSCEALLGHTDASYTAAVDDGTYTDFVYDGAGYGLCQWTFWSRKEGLLNRARSGGVSISDLQMQLAYMRSEWTVSARSWLESMPDTADGAYDAALWYCLNWEKPADMAYQAMVRGELAKNTFWVKYCPIKHEAVSADTVRWQIVPEAFAGQGCVIVTAYDQNGRLSDHKLFPVNDLAVGAADTAALKAAENGYYKVLLVDMQTFSPLTAAQNGTFAK